MNRDALAEFPGGRYLTDLQLLGRLLDSAKLANSAEDELFALGHADGVASAKQFPALHNDLGSGTVVGVSALALVLFIPNSSTTHLVAPAEVSFADLSEATR